MYMRVSSLRCGRKLYYILKKDDTRNAAGDMSRKAERVWVMVSPRGRPLSQL